jgi:hypothetical protein
MLAIVTRQLVMGIPLMGAISLVVFMLSSRLPRAPPGRQILGPTASPTGFLLNILSEHLGTRSRPGQCSQRHSAGSSATRSNTSNPTRRQLRTS